MNRNDNKYERESLKDRIKELSSLGLFTIAIAVFSVILMNLIVFPLSYFAVNNVNLFNIIFKNLFLALITFSIIFYLFSRVRALRRMEFKYRDIGLYFLRRPFYYLSVFLFFIFISSILITSIYYLFNINYFFIHRLTGGVV